jgi:hypothetical protein
MCSKQVLSVVLLGRKSWHTVPCRLPVTKVCALPLRVAMHDHRCASPCAMKVRVGPGPCAQHPIQSPDASIT